MTYPPAKKVLKEKAELAESLGKAEKHTSPIGILNGTKVPKINHTHDHHRAHQNPIGHKETDNRIPEIR